MRNVLIVLTILVSAMFLTELILVNKIGTFLFWLYLGSVSSQLVKTIINSYFGDKNETIND